MRLVTTVHGWVHHTTRTPLYYRVDRYCLPRYERVICVSDDLFEACLSAGVPRRNCVLLENGIDAAEYRRRQTTAEAKAALGYSPGAVLVGAVGRLEKEKAFDVLVGAVADLVAAGTDARLVIVGEGSDRSRLEALAADLGVLERVALPGWQADVRTYYEAMDLFALSSLREGLPNVLLEAMALEVPVVATRVNGVPRVITDGQNGILVDAGDRPQMAAALRGLLADPDRMESLRRAGRMTAETRYSFATRIDRLRRIYDELLGVNRSPADQTEDRASCALS
jgi:glycosyltransferase involved in cell wall biosynthesis